MFFADGGAKEVDRGSARLLMAAALAFAALSAAVPALLAAELPVSGNSPAPVCLQIRATLVPLAEAERNQAFALQLYARAPGFGQVEAALDDLLNRSAELRKLLHRLAADDRRGEPVARGCIRRGYRSLIEAERLTKDVEQVVFANYPPLPTAPAEPLAPLGDGPVTSGASRPDTPAASGTRP